MNKKRKIRPIKYYINDKEEMINQIFSCVSEKQIKKMIPPTLKDLSIDEVKAECLVQLLTMSNNTIISILEGQKSFAKEIEKPDNHFEEIEFNFNSENKNSSNRKLKNGKERASSKSPSPKSYEADRITVESSSGTTSSKRKLKEKKHKSEKKKRKISHEEEKIEDPETKGKNLLEIIELEMRAKAIRSLLQKEEELEKLKELNDEANNHFRGSEILNNQKPPSKDDSAEESKIDIATIIAKNEIKNRIKQLRNKEERRYRQTASSSSHKNCPNVTKTLKQKDEIKEKIGEKKLENLINKKLEEEGSREKYEWNVEEEKLIYEDDEYDSDDKLQEDRNKDDEKSEENSRSSWAERWLQSKDVKKVVATSKMLTVVRNKMKNNLKSHYKQAITNNVSNRTHCPPTEMEGSVKEYDTLLQMHEAVEAAAIHSNK